MNLRWLRSEEAGDSRFEPLLEALRAEGAVPLGEAPGEAGIVVVFAGEDGRIPDRPAWLADNWMPVLVGRAWWRLDVAPDDVLRRWAPWRVAGDLLPEEWPQHWPQSSTDWLRERFAWIQPTQSEGFFPCRSSDAGGRVLLVYDQPGLSNAFVRGFGDSSCACGTMHAIRDALSEEGVDCVEIGLVVKRPTLIAEGRFRGLVLGVGDPGDAHWLWRLGALAGLPRVNLLCSRASLIRGLPESLLAKVANKAGIRPTFAPLFRWLASAHDHAGEDLTSLASSDCVRMMVSAVLEDPDRAGFFGRLNQCLRERKSPVVCFKSSGASVEDIVGPDAPGCTRDVMLRSIRMFLQEWPRPGWSGDFCSYHAHFPEWVELCCEAGARNGESSEALDPLGRVAVGIFDGVCQRFGSAWRGRHLMRAIELWKSDRDQRRMSDTMMCEEVKGRAALGQVVEVDQLIETNRDWPSGFFFELAWIGFRELMPEIETVGYDSMKMAPRVDAVRRWLSREPATEHLVPTLQGFEAMIDAYAGARDAALDRLLTSAGEWNAILGVWLWVLGDEEAARTCVHRVDRATVKMPVGLASAAALHALTGDASEAVRYLERLVSIAPRYAAGVDGPPDTRWMLLGLCMQALGHGRLAELFRTRARNLHPHGERRDLLFERVRMQDLRVAIPVMETD